MKSTDLIYEKWGTRIAEPDESDAGVQDFAFTASKKTAEDSGWELLTGPVERVPVGFWDGDQVYAYLWPVARAAKAVDA